MANRTIKVYGNNHAADTALTVTWNSVEVYNGTLSASVIDFADVYGGETTEPEELFEFTYNNAEDTIESSHTLRDTVTAGSGSVRQIFDISNNSNDNYDTYPADGKPPVHDIGGKWYWVPGSYGVYHDGTAPNEALDDTKINRSGFTLNGQPIEKDETASASWNWTGSIFNLSNGDEFGCSVRVAKTLVANPNAGKGYWWTAN